MAKKLRNTDGTQTGLCPVVQNMVCWPGGNGTACDQTQPSRAVTCGTPLMIGQQPVGV